MRVLDLRVWLVLDTLGQGADGHGLSGDDHVPAGVFFNSLCVSLQSASVWLPAHAVFVITHNVSERLPMQFPLLLLNLLKNHTSHTAAPDLRLGREAAGGGAEQGVFVAPAIREQCTAADDAPGRLHTLNKRNSQEHFIFQTCTK